MGIVRDQALIIVAMEKSDEDLVSLAPSEGTSWSQVTHSSSNPDQTRIFVTLSNGTRLFVPVPQNSTIHDLHQKALRRAVRFGFQWNATHSYLQTISRPPVVLDGEDKLLDVLDLTEDNTFNLCSLVEGSSTTLCVPQPTTPLDGLVYIRWITLEDAFLHPHLSAIKFDDQPFSENMPLHQFYKIAVERILGSSDSPPGSARPQMTLYLKDCALSAQENAASLKELGLAGTVTSPLDIFVDVDRSARLPVESISNTSTDLDSLWGFPTTKRGICALITTLKILTKAVPLEDALNMLFELTHFPPILLGYKDIHQKGVHSSYNMASIRLLANAFQILCLQTAPSWICQTAEMALESSRQLIAWICSLDSGIKADVHPTIHFAIVVKRQAQSRRFEALPYTFDVKMSTVSESGPDQDTELQVSLGHDDRALASRLAHRDKHDFAATCSNYLKYTGDWSKLLAHRRVPTPQPTEFDLLLQNAAVSDKFRMVGPPQLGGVLTNQLPVITLSSEGLVSVYDQEFYDCSEKRFFTWNAIQKKEVMKHTNPEQYLMQKLEPIIVERKKEHTWETDAWSDWTKGADFGTPEEAVVVCMDASGSMATVMPTGWLSQDSQATGVLPSRLTEVKEFFKNFALRVSALRLSTYLGLVTYSSTTQIEVKQDLTPVKLNFEDRVKEIKALSSTAMYNGLNKARTMLNELKNQHPKVQCRIILLTDGADNSSTFSPELVGRDLAADDIVLDSVVIGTDLTENLFKISNLTGGYAFAPATQQVFFQIFLLETMVDIRTRPDIAKKRMTGTWLEYTPKVQDMPNAYTFPPCRPHPNQGDYFIALADADRYLSRQNRQPGSGSMSVQSLSTRSTSTSMTGTTLSSGASGAPRIILNEIKEMINNPHQYMDVYVSESNMGFWKVAMQGPPASPYADGVFMLYIEIGREFPLKPPSARFITPMLHPNITKHGRICHPIFDREWTGTTHVYQVLQHIWGILMSLEARDAVDPLSTLKFWTDPAQGKQEVEQYVQRFASHSRANIRSDIVGSDTSSVSSRSTESWEIESISSTKSSRITHTATPGSVVGCPTSNRQTPTARTPATPASTRRASSTISSYLAAQRGPPPMMNMPGQNNAEAARRGVSVPSSADGGRKLGRRQSFFNMFKK